MDIHALGWTDALDAAFQPHRAAGLVPGRVAAEHKGAYTVYAHDGELLARNAGRLELTATDRYDLPAVGDWVAVRADKGSSTIHAVLERRSAFVRKQAGFTTTRQVVAANFDSLWILGSLNAELSARRMERFLAVAWETGAQPVVVLTKTDLDQADPGRVAEVEAVAVGAPVHRTSVVTGEGLDELRTYLAGARTAALLGASGVGKSTLVNALAGAQLLETNRTRPDDVGRHTTTRRELVLLPGGGTLIDTPGLREVALWDPDGADTLFEDVQRLAARCHFRDCGHRSEPGCAIKAAIASGELDAEHLHAYEKMQRELAHTSRRRKYRPGVAWRQGHKKMSARRRSRKLGEDPPR